MQSFQLYEPGDSFLYRLDPRTKLVTVVVVFGLSILFTDARYLAPVFAFIVAVAAAGRVPLRRVAVLLKSLAVLVAIALVMWPLIYRNGDVLFQLWWIDVTEGGVLYGLGMAFRILCMVITPIVLFITTPQPDFVAGLRRLGLPYKASFALAMALRFLPTVVGVGQTIVEAQRARGLDPSKGSPARRLRAYGRMLGPLVITSIRIAQQAVLAVEARAFSIDRKRTFVRQLTMARRDAFALVVVGVLVAALVALRIQGYGLL
jgi:energy-coupling factor transport system permease protein